MSNFSKNVMKYAEVGYQRLGTISVRVSDEDFAGFVALTSELCSQCQVNRSYFTADFVLSLFDLGNMTFNLICGVLSLSVCLSFVNLFLLVLIIYLDHRKVVQVCGRTYVFFHS